MLRALLFVIAVVVFYLGLGVGLQINPAAGMALWGVAAVIVALNLIWLARFRRKVRQAPGAGLNG